MTSVPIVLETSTPTLDDATVLDGAATVWAVISFATELPATPENKAALDRARAIFLDELRALGFGEADLDRYLKTRGSGVDRQTRGRPPDG